MYEILNRFRLCFGEETGRAFWVLCYDTSQPQNIHKVLPGSKTTRITHTVSENCGPRDDRLPRQFSIDSAFTFRWMIRTAYTRRRRRSIGHSSARYSANWLRFYVKFEWTWGHTSRSSAAESQPDHTTNIWHTLIFHVHWFYVFSTFLSLPSMGIIIILIMDVNFATLLATRMFLSMAIYAIERWWLFNQDNHRYI